MTKAIVEDTRILLKRPKSEKIKRLEKWEEQNNKPSATFDYNDRNIAPISGKDQGFFGIDPCVGLNCHSLRFYKKNDEKSPNRRYIIADLRSIMPDLRPAFLSRGL